MQGLSETCQNPFCAKKARFCCDRCLKRTYCSSDCQKADWDHHKTRCTENEKREEIIAQMAKIRDMTGSVFTAKTTTETARSQKTVKSISHVPKPPKKERKDSTRYNSSLLPYAVETVNDKLAFIIQCIEKYTIAILEHITTRSSQVYKRVSIRALADLYKTSTISETFDVITSYIKKLKTLNKSIDFSEEGLNKTPKSVLKGMVALCKAFHYPDIEKEIENLSLVSTANDYHCTGKERKFCTHCGDRENLVDHPKLKYVYLCSSCLNEYKSNKWQQEDDHDMECYCCGDGGNVVLCDFCNHSMCSNCIMLHQGEAEWEAVHVLEKWKCMYCKVDNKNKPIFRK